MNKIDVLLPEELLRRYRDTITRSLKNDGDDRLAEMVDEALTAYESEKSLLEKTQDWHSHGTVAPSCVGCPTAKAMIEGDWVMVKQGMLLTYISCAVVFSSERMTEAERRKEVDRIFALFTEGRNDG